MTEVTFLATLTTPDENIHGFTPEQLAMFFEKIVKEHISEENGESFSVTDIEIN